jgi:acyl-coenzyme A thioesterase PaaI-like protein
MELNTHLQIDNTINGTVVELEEGYAKVELATQDFMVVDKEGLVHGGFAFGAADFAAMAAVNDPFVVLAKSEVKFLAPVKLGETMVFEGRVVSRNGMKQSVEVEGRVGDKKVFTGTFYTVVLERHLFTM